ncbi:DUF4174 domain-containing protein [Mangrovicoccus sp. HB161399]|uniref:DUF4174 domain-containing protein n=1 Tax=Mangrovicoccus sp. HB161399 TaxID=2720392 RepID=UPI001552573F|nr:DUF4174 domain-containing protein [Mangrovicoccus sp. HB161399]
MTRPAGLTALLCSLVLPAAALAEIPAGRVPGTEDALGSYRWNSRPVLVFAPAASDPRYAAQIEALTSVAEDLEARDIIVLTDTDPGHGSELRRGIGEDDATLVLVGKDGGVKLRAAAPVDPEQILSLVDRMPMRQREMKE